MAQKTYNVTKITGWRDERTNKMDDNSTDMRPVAYGISQSALIRRCKTLLLMLIGIIAGHYLWQATHDCNWTQAERYAVWDAITLLLALMLPYK